MDIFQKVKEVICDTIGEENIMPDQELKADFGLDSLSLVAVVVELEEKFGIEFNESDLDPSKIIHVRDLIELVEKYI